MIAFDGHCNRTGSNWELEMLSKCWLLKGEKYTDKQFYSQNMAAIDGYCQYKFFCLKSLVKKLTNDICSQKNGFQTQWFEK